MRLVIANQYVTDWASIRIPHLFGTMMSGASGFGVLDEHDQLIAAIVFTHYDPDAKSIDISFVAASPRCLTKSMVQAIFAYPFDQLKVQRVSAVTPKKNRPARQFLEKFGFKREGLARRAFGNYGDAVLYSLLEHEWRASRFHPRSTLDGQENPDRSRARPNHDGERAIHS